MDEFQYVLPPWEHQKIEFEHSRELEARALLWQMRTGKTKVIIDTAAWLYLKKLIDAVLIVTRSGVYENWITRELPKHCSVPYQAVWWEADKAGTKANRDVLHDLVCSPELVIFSINNESFIRPRAQCYISRFLKLRVLLVVDEVHDFRTASSIRSRLIRGVAKYCPYRRILTGTNNGNSPLGNWSQFEILQPGALGFKTWPDFEQYYGVFEERKRRNKSGRMVTYMKESSYRCLDELRASIEPWSSIIRRKDCPDLPELIHSTIDVYITDEQRRVYRELKFEFETDLKSGVIVQAAEIAHRRMKMQQVLSNFIIDEYKKPHLIDASRNPRLDTLVQYLRDLDDEKVIVWCRFSEDIRLVANRLKLEKIVCVEYHGLVNKPLRRLNEESFREDPAVQVFLGQPQSAGLGLDLSAASAIIWYSHVDDIVIRDQANERATEKGQTAVAVIDFVVPRSVDPVILEGHARKRAIIDYMEGGTLEDYQSQDWRQRALDTLRKDGI